MKIKIYRLKLILMSLLFISPNLFSINGEEIMKKVFDQKKGSNVKMEVEMSLINSIGSKKVRKLAIARVIGKKEIKTLFEFRYPSDVKGVKFLSIDQVSGKKESRRWIYMPAIRRIRRVSGSSRNDYFMGSDLTYNDLRKIDVSEEEHTLKGERIIDGELCYVVVSVPREMKRSIYGKKISYITKKTSVVIFVEFFDKKGKLVKTMKINGQKKVKGILVIGSIHVKNIPKKHQTILKFNSVKPNVRLSPALFSPTRLHGARIN